MDIGHRKNNGSHIKETQIVHTHTLYVSLLIFI